MKTLLFLLILNPSLASSQDQAERLYDNAITFMNAGKYSAAITDFSSIISDYSDTEWAPRALLQLGVYYLEVESSPSKSLKYMEQIQKDHKSSEQAPAAYYYKAFIAMQQGQSHADLEVASANLTRMSNLFPGNRWQAKALFLFGQLALRLGDYSQSLSHFQRLEFAHPHSPNMATSCLHAAKAAYLLGKPRQAALVLARLQANLPNSPESETAAAHLRLLDNFSGTKTTWLLDKSFFGAAPKRYSNPTVVYVSGDERIAIKDQRSAFIAPLTAETQPAISSTNLVEFTSNREGQLLLVYKNRIVSQDGSSSFKSLSGGSNPLRDIKTAAMDDYGRLFVVDGNYKGVLIYDKAGRLIKSLSFSRPKRVRSFGNTTWILDDSGLNTLDANLTPSTSTLPSLGGLLDFCFDGYGNYYALHEKGSQVSIFSHGGRRIANLNLKSGGFPLKLAASLAVDAAGALYLANRRGGAVYRFH